MTSLPERIADLALNTFNRLPQKYKPRVHPDGRREWTPMAALVLVTDTGDEHTHETLKCVSLATGTKCLPSSAIPKCHGLILHDCHAEVLALRGLNRWILDEMRVLLDHMTSTDDTSYISDVVELLPPPALDSDKTTATTSSLRAFHLRDDVSIYMFTTTAPCGDASMDLQISSNVDSTPWCLDSLAPLPRSANSGLAPPPFSEQAPPGRGYYSLLGHTRRKPSRADAPTTMSKSCSDKLALKQFTGLLTFPLDVLLQADTTASDANNKNDNGSNAFLKGLVVYPDQYHSLGYERCWGSTGRLKTVTADGRIKARWFDFHVLPSTCPRFEFEKPTGGEKECKATNVSAVYVAGSKGRPATTEVLVNGVKQGYKQFEERVGKGSVLCRRKMLEVAGEVEERLREKWSNCMVEEENIGGQKAFYSQLKKCEERRWRYEIKEYVVGKMGGWVSNSMEDDFEVYTDKKVT